MKKMLLRIFLALTIAVSAFAVTAVSSKVIHIEIVSAGKFVVDGKPASAATLSGVIGAMVEDKDHTAVEITVPQNVDKAAVEQVKDAGRKVGVYLFSLVTKPAAKG